MGKNTDLLIEIGTEELPPKFLRGLSDAFATAIQKGLEKATLSHGAVTVYATPRRLGVMVASVETAQAEIFTDRRGPSVHVAFDATGQPTKAAKGFAESCGADIKQLSTIKTDKGEWLTFRITKAGHQTETLLPEIIVTALKQLPIQRRMRWGNGEIEFVRPVHWAVVMLGKKSVKAEILGVVSGRHTRGHRFHQPIPLSIESASAYAPMLYSQGHVIANYQTRLKMIRELVEKAACRCGGVAHIDQGLLEEVTSLVEWPVPVTGSFDEKFLKLPRDVLIATMKEAQKYFHVEDTNGQLLPKFITISNIRSRSPESVREGNERVIRPRLEDAAFFVQTDRRRGLESFIQGTKSLTFQEKLGTIYDKAQRISKLTAQIAIEMGCNQNEVKLAQRAGYLCKCDLVSNTVNEFPELQGIMGREYALESGESRTVAEAIGEVYLPRFSGDQIPATRIGQILSIADKLDTLVGIFGIKQLPKGDKDPFALRRQSLGILRIIIESKLNLELLKLINASIELYGELINIQIKESLFVFMTDRLKAYFSEQGINANVFAAVAARRPTYPLDFANRIVAVQQFTQLPEATSLAVATKRINNILKQCTDDIPETVKENLFEEKAERKLAAQLNSVGPRAKELLSAGNYSQAMTMLASLRESVDDFFDTVKVIADSSSVRLNRLALLKQVNTLFSATADISYLQR